MKKKITKNKKIVNKGVKKILDIYVIRSLILDVIMIGIGMFFLIKPSSGLRACEIIFSILMIFTGIMAIFDGTAKKAIKIFNFHIIYGVLSTILGILVIINPFSLINALLIAFGIWLIISGLIKINYAINLKKIKEDCWPLILFIGIIIGAFGVLVIINPFINFYITQIIGLFIIFYGVLELMNSLIFKKILKEIVELFK